MERKAAIFDTAFGRGDAKEWRIYLAGAVEGALPLDAAVRAPALRYKDAEGFDGLYVPFVVEETFAFEDYEVGTFNGGGGRFCGHLGIGFWGGLGVRSVTGVEAD